EPALGEAPDVLRPGALQRRATLHVACERPRFVARVVAGDARRQVAKHVALLLDAEIDDVRAAGRGRPPRALQRQRAPAGAAAAGERAGTARARAGQDVGGAVLPLVVTAVVVD